MNANEKYHTWLEGYLRETVDTALEKPFTDLHFYKKRKTEVMVQKKSRTEYFSKTFKAHITREQKAIKIFYDLFEPMDFRNKDSSHEHHDLIVGTGDQEII